MSANYMVKLTTWGGEATVFIQEEEGQLFRYFIDEDGVQRDALYVNPDDTDTLWCFIQSEYTDWIVLDADEELGFEDGQAIECSEPMDTERFWTPEGFREEERFQQDAITAIIHEAIGEEHPAAVAAIRDADVIVGISPSFKHLPVDGITSLTLCGEYALREAMEKGQPVKVLRVPLTSGVKALRTKLKAIRGEEDIVLRLDHAIAHPLELDRKLLPVGGGDFEADVLYLGHVITIWRYDRDCESTYGWDGAGKQNGEVLDSLEECLEDCRKALGDKAVDGSNWQREGF